MAMKPHKKVQHIAIAGKILKYDAEEPLVVDTHKITKAERAWDGHIVQIRDLGNGQSQIVHL